MKSSRRRLVVLALTLLAAVGGAAFGTDALHSGGSRAGTSAGGSWYSVADGMTTPAA